MDWGRTFFATTPSRYQDYNLACISAPPPPPPSVVKRNSFRRPEARQTCGEEAEKEHHSFPLHPSPLPHLPFLLPLPLPHLPFLLPLPLRRFASSQLYSQTKSNGKAETPFSSFRPRKQKKTHTSEPPMIPCGTPSRSLSFRWCAALCAPQVLPLGVPATDGQTDRRTNGQTWTLQN